MVEQNMRVMETLNRYISEGVDPHYAIMVNGEWGCGKTFFIKEKWMQQIENKEKYSIINLSLFGLKNVNEIKEEIPFNEIIFKETLDKSKKNEEIIKKGKELTENNFVKNIGNVANKLLESKVGIGLDDLSKIFTRDWLSEKIEGITKVLILDDLERTKMDLKEIFGFVSSHIENTSLRVIFLCNDDEIKKTQSTKIKEDIKIDDFIYDEIVNKDIDKYNNHKFSPKLIKVISNIRKIETQKKTNNDEDYRRIREKVIGETLKLEADIEEALVSFFKEMKYSIVEMNQIEPIIKEVMVTLGYNNLRVVRQTLMKLQPLLNEIINAKSYHNYPHKYIEVSGKIKPKEYYVEMVIKFFIVANMKKLMGCLEPNGLWMTGLLNGFELYKPLAQLEEIYKIWVSYIWGGELNKDIIYKAVNEDMKTLTPQDIVEKDNIYKLQVGYWDYTKEEFYDIQSKMIDELKNGKYTDIRAIMQGYCLLITFEKDGILADIDDIDIFFNDVLKSLKLNYSNEKEITYTNIDYEYIDFFGYRGYQLYYTADKTRVVKFFNKLKEVYKEIRKESIKEKIDTLLLKIISVDTQVDDLFDNIDRNQPLLDIIGINRLCQILHSISLLEQRRFFDKLMNRYGLNSVGAEESYLIYKPDKIILEKLVDIYTENYEKAKTNRDNKVSMYAYLKADAEKTLVGFNKKMESGESFKK